MHHVDMPIRTRRRLGYEDRLCAVRVRFDDISGFPQLVDPDQAGLEARRSCSFSAPTFFLVSDRSWL